MLETEDARPRLERQMTVAQESPSGTSTKTANREHLPERRPLWQRLSFPVLGAVMIATGALGLIVPIIPGIVLFALGFPLLFCFHQASEDWAIGVMHNWYVRLQRMFLRKE